MSGGGKPTSMEDDLAQIRQRSIDDDLAAIRGSAPASADEAKPSTTLEKISAAAKKAFANSPLGVTAHVVSHPLESLLNIGKAVPGGEAAQAGFAMLGSRIPKGVPLLGNDGPALSYEDALAAIHDATKGTPGMAGLLEKVPGAVVGGSLLPGGSSIAAMMKGGAAYGVADRALAAKPESLDERLAGTVKAGAIGAVAAPVVGKALQLGAAGVGAMGAEAPDATLLAQKEARDVAAKANYAKALLEGQGQTDTPAVRAFLLEPDIAPIVARLQQSREFAALDPHSPEMLDQVYKELSSSAGDLQRGLLNPSAANGASRRLDLRDTRAAQGDLLSAVDQPMPSYRGAVRDYAKQSGEIDATKKGVDALRGARATGMSGKAAASQKSPSAILDWLQNDATPQEAERYMQGLDGAAKTRLSHEITSPLSLLHGGPLRTLNASAKMNPGAVPSTLRNSVLAALLQQLEGQ